MHEHSSFQPYFLHTREAKQLIDSALTHGSDIGRFLSQLRALEGTDSFSSLVSPNPTTFIVVSDDASTAAPLHPGASLGRRSMLKRGIGFPSLITPTY
jgi:hypothetical protein